MQRRIDGGRPAVAVLSFGLALAAGLLAAGLLAPSPARAVQPYALSFADTRFDSADPEVREQTLGLAARLDASHVRIDAGWKGIAPVEPADPANPADPAYRFADLDRSVTGAIERGLVPVISFAGAPGWAEGPNRPRSAPPGTWKPDPRALGQFARALVGRYDGTYPDPARPGEVLPRVAIYEVWNEPTLSKFLTPQWSGTEPKSPEIYRRMLNSFAASARAVQPDVKIIAGAMSPYGDGPGGLRMYPMRFLRELVCLRGRRTLRRIPSCARPSFDVLSSHPISPFGGPRAHAADPQDLAIADLGELRRILRAAERRGTLAPAPPRPMWVTEYWWETPPENHEGTPSLRRQARWIAEAQLLFWKQRVPVAMLFQVIDEAFDPEEHWSTSWQTGLYFHGGAPKPSLAAARFPVAAERRGRSHVYVWTRPPESGTLTFQRRVQGSWRRVARVTARAGVPLGRTIRMRRGGRLRAVIDGHTSYVYRQRG